MSCRIAVVLLTANLFLGAETTSPGYPDYRKANSLFVAGRFPESLLAIEEALRLDPDLVPALTLRAKLAMAASRYDTARKSLEHALAVDPGAQYAHFLYGMEAYMNNDMQAALPRFQKARQLDPRDPRAALYLGLTTESIGRPDDALALYVEAARLERATGKLQADTLLPGARLLMLLGRFEESERWIAAALKLSPNLRDSHFELARLLLKKGVPAEAAAEGELALKLSGGVVTDASIRYLLIRAYGQAGVPDRAATHAAILRAEERK